MITIELLEHRLELVLCALNSGTPNVPGARVTGFVTDVTATTAKCGKLLTERVVQSLVSGACWIRTNGTELPVRDISNDPSLSVIYDLITYLESTQAIPVESYVVR